MSDDTADDAKTERRAWIVWGALIAIAVGVYELFQQPALLGATISLKFAWGDARTGWWLWGRDPNRRRGQAHFWVYLGYGLWKSAIIGIVLSFAFVFLDVAIQGPVNQRPAKNQDDTLKLIFAGSCSSGGLLAVLSGLVTVYGFLVARRAKLKLWLNSSVAAARVRNIWPPDFGDTNRMSSIALPSAFAAMVLLFTTILVPTLIMLDPKGDAKELILGVVLFSLLGLIFGTLFFLDWVRKHLIAASPIEAWPDEPDEWAGRS